ncbi:MAG: MaoC family dehydratase [Natronomonas sp.]
MEERVYPTEMALYFEDVTVGNRYETSQYTITKEEIITFAEQFDPQPFHTDEKAAKESMFGGLVASGLHTLCLSARLFITEYVNPEDGLKYMGGIGMDDLQWHEPVRPGDTLHVEMEVVDKTASETRDDRGYVEFKRSAYTDEEVMSIRSHHIIERRQ